MFTHETLGRAGAKPMRPLFFQINSKIFCCIRASDAGRATALERRNEPCLYVQIKFILTDVGQLADLRHGKAAVTETCFHGKLMGVLDRVSRLYASWLF